MVWYADGSTGEFDLPIGAVVNLADSSQIMIKTDDGEVRRAILPFWLTKHPQRTRNLQEKWIPASEHAKLKIMHPTSVHGVEDMVRLPPPRA